ncbi:MAG: signal peptidase I [Patescibacteria group bacterium]
MEHERHDTLVDDLVKFALIALLIVLPIRMFIAQPYIVRGASMEPTFLGGEYLIVDQISYRLGDPERGDVIILKYPKDESIFFIKRVIGLPGETVEIIGKRIVIERGNNLPVITLDEPYIAEDRLQDEYGVYVLGDNEYFVMGDNRRESSDSRSWGVLKRNEVVGRAFLRLLPVTRVDMFPGAYTQGQ